MTALSTACVCAEINTRHCSVHGQGDVAPLETPGATNLTWDQAVEMYDRYGIAYRAVADGSKGGHTPGRRYGHGRLATSVKTRRR